MDYPLKAYKVKIYPMPINANSRFPLNQKRFDKVTKNLDIMVRINNIYDVSDLQYILSKEAIETTKGRYDYENIRILCVFYFKNGRIQKVYMDGTTVYIGNKQYECPSFIEKVLEYLPSDYGY